MRWINVTVAVAMLVHVVCVPCFAQDVSREAEDAVGEHVKAGVSEPIPMGVGTTVLKGILIGAAAGAVVGFAIGPYESEASSSSFFDGGIGFEWSREEATLGGALIGGVVGAIIGAFIGSNRKNAQRKEAPLNDIWIGLSPKRHGGTMLRASYSF